VKRGWIAALVLACVSCTAAEPGPDDESGGMAGSTAGVGAPPVTADAGAPAPAGSSAAGAGAGGSAGAGLGAGTGGTAGLGGAGGAGGAAGLDGASGSGGVGGAAGAGAGGAGAGGASARVAVPSEGCGKSGRPSGGEVVAAGSHIYSFPEGYDGTTPSPLIMAFHAAGNENDQLRNITRGSALDQHFVMAFPSSAGNGWSPGTDGASIDARYEELLASYCIDQSRVFATGHSSGAQLIVQLMCDGDDRFAAIAPVASSAYCPSWDDPVPALIIHGVDDKERANTNQDADGTKDLAPYLLSNQCGTTTMPHAQAGCSSSGMQVDPGCVQYEGCAEPTIWCHHDDPQYGTSNHGWPCFANDAIDAFFGGLP
jgi:polyhydroxybutyrate depolymerase